MRKFLLSFFAAVFLMCSAMPASAVHVKSATEKGISEIEIGGELLTKGWLFDETYTQHKPASQRNPDESLRSDRTHSYWQTNFLLETAYIASEDLKGVWVIEIEDVIWGHEGTSGEAGSGGNQGTNAANILTNQLYVDFKVPAVPVRMTVGLQNFTLGHSVILDDEAGGVNIAVDVDPVTINLFTFKGHEGDTNAADDIDFYGLSTNVSLGDAGSIGLFGIWGHATDAAVASELFDGAYDVDGLIGAATTSDFHGADAMWYGLTGDLAFDPIEIQFEADIYQATWDSKSGNRSYNAGGFFAWLDLGFNLGDAGKAGLAGVYASGNENDSYITPSGGPNYHNNNFTQISTLDRTDGCVLGWDNLFIRDGVAYNQSVDGGPTSGNDNVLRNLYSAKLYANLNPTDWLAVGANVNAYWKANSYRGNDDGEGAYYGTEVDLDVAVQIYDQLTWTIEGGYMFTSDRGLSNNPTDSSLANNAQGVSGSGDEEKNRLDNTNIWAVVSGLVYNF